MILHTLSIYFRSVITYFQVNDAMNEISIIIFLILSSPNKTITFLVLKNPLSITINTGLSHITQLNLLNIILNVLTFLKSRYIPFDISVNVRSYPTTNIYSFAASPYSRGCSPIRPRQPIRNMKKSKCCPTPATLFYNGKSTTGRWTIRSY